MQSFEREHFIGKDIMLDEFHLYFNCTFQNCRFIYNGAQSYLLQGCQTAGTVDFRTDSPAIANAISLLKGFGFLDRLFAASWNQDARPTIIGLH